MLRLMVSGGGPWRLGLDTEHSKVGGVRLGRPLAGGITARMDFKAALAGQYRAGLAMLRQCVELCPDDLWAAGEHPRTFWRIAYHATFFTHVYLMPHHEAFVPWAKHVWHGRILWDDDEEGNPPRETTLDQAEIIEYVDHVSGSVDGWLAALDLASPDSGFPWYQIPKLDHQILSVRHLGVHVAQLQELLYARGLDPDWQSSR